MGTDRQMANRMLGHPLGPQPIFLNKVLLAPSQTPFVPVSWRLLQRLLPGPLQSKFTNSELQQSTWGQGDDLRPAKISLLPPTHASTACICVQARAPAHQHAQDMLGCLIHRVGHTCIYARF